MGGRLQQLGSSELKVNVWDIWEVGQCVFPWGLCVEWQWGRLKGNFVSLNMGLSPGGSYSSEIKLPIPLSSEDALGTPFGRTGP